ncbi:hypothetical protein RIF29_23813 [Crotalaria pallida]|uniref:SHSP domain-containing protein n=1 Tax=Crotalaria pallida TaxID=3830 RepID=A0AAN9F871_CROPI
MIPSSSSSLNWNWNWKEATFIAIFFLILSTSAANNNIKMKKVHPVPKKRNNITVQFDSDHLDKKLRRLPHVFSRVLELPFPSDADVTIIEEADCFRFIAETDGMGDVRAHTVEIHPDVIKIVVRVGAAEVELSLDHLEIDTWRFRLPDSTLPDLATASFVNGDLVVTVPKRYVDDDGDGDDGDFDRFVIVQ